MTFVRRVLHSGSNECGTCGFLLLVALLEEIDADLVSVHPGQFAAPIGEPRRRQQEKKFLQVQTFDRALDGELGSDLGDVLHDAVAPPGPVDPHHLGRYPALEYDAIAFVSLVARHHARSLQPVRLRPPASQDTGALLTAGKSGARRRDV